MPVKFISYHLVSQSIAALCSWRWPAPCPALASVAMMTMSSGKPVPSPLASMSVAMGISVLRSTVHTPSPTWLLSRTIWVVSSCRSCLFSCTISSCSESFGGVAVIRVSQDCRREGSTQASWAKEPHRPNRLGFGFFSAGEKCMMKLRGIYSSFSSKSSALKSVNITKLGQYSFKIITDLLSWKSLVKNFSTLLQNFGDRFSLAVAIIIWTSSPLKKKKPKICEVTEWMRSQIVLSAETIPEWKEFFHCLSDLTAFKLFFKVLKAFLKDGLIQTTKKYK